jgi:hypothetical protein
MSGRPKSWEYSHDGWTTIGIIAFTYAPVGGPGVDTYTVDTGSAQPTSDLNSLVDCLDELEEELAGTGDPTDLQKRTAGGLVLILNPDVVPPTIKIGTASARPAALQFALRDELRTKLGYPGTPPSP